MSKRTHKPYAAKLHVTAFLAIVLLALPSVAAAQDAVAQENAGLLELEPFDLVAEKRADDERDVGHFAGIRPLEIDVWTNGRWDRIPEQPDFFRWRLLIRSPDAMSLSLAFSRFELPPSARLEISTVDGTQRLRPLTEADNKESGEFWTPPLFTDALFLELVLREEAADLLDLEIAQLHHGYAGFGEPEPRSGSCQRDVACSRAPVWRDVARSVGLVSIDGVRFCSGFLVNNTALDGRPLFITARHCGVDQTNAGSVVVMWNYESPQCRLSNEPSSESLHPAIHFQTGAKLLASWENSDFLLLELDDVPDPSWDLHFAGWDRSHELPQGAVSIHHPETDVKRISFASGLTKATRYTDERESDGDHLRVVWNSGTTEGGSSGAPLFNLDQRVVGQLHGGYASCGNEEADWFGRLASSWEGGGTSKSRLSDWLDPLDTEEETLDGVDARELLDILDR